MTSQPPSGQRCYRFGGECERRQGKADRDRPRRLRASRLPETTLADVAAAGGGLADVAVADKYGKFDPGDDARPPDRMRNRLTCAFGIITGR
jgi:hypothetical protein